MKKAISFQVIAFAAILWLGKREADSSLDHGGDSLARVLVLGLLVASVAMSFISIFKYMSFSKDRDSGSIYGKLPVWQGLSFAATGILFGKSMWNMSVNHIIYNDPNSLIYSLIVSIFIYTIISFAVIVRGGFR